MLNIYVDGIPETEMIMDVEAEFLKVRLSGTREERELISVIEKGEYNDDKSFIDRFGYKLYLSELSTGCKAALCVISFPDKVINLHECGFNARDTIINYCSRGNIFINENGVYIREIKKEIDVKVDSFQFTTIDRLNKYIFSERPFEPDMHENGIKQLSDNQPIREQYGSYR